MMKFLSLLIFFLLTNSCKYKLSTYSADAPEQKLNEVNLERIRAQEANVGGDFKIALISDTHNYYEELDELVKTINARGPYSFVIVSGDISNLGLLEEYDNTRRFLNKLHYPYLVSVGNHDLLANGEEIYQRMFGQNDFDFLYKNIHFILFDNNNWENAGVVPNISWLQERLVSSGGSDKVLVAHVPPDDRDRFSDEEISDFGNLLDSHNVNYFINGHNHNPGEATFGNAVQITVGAPTKGFYFELQVSAGGITHQKISF